MPPLSGLCLLGDISQVSPALRDNSGLKDETMPLAFPSISPLLNRPYLRRSGQTSCGEREQMSLNKHVQPSSFVGLDVEAAPAWAWNGLRRRYAVSKQFAIGFRRHSVSLFEGTREHDQ